MSTPNPRLEVVLARFSGQPNITADQAMQLRNALTQDAAVLQHYNQLATDGHLSGFGLPHGNDPNLIGNYHMASGIVTLPAGALQPAGTLPTPELRAALRIQEMSARYAHGTWTDAANVPQPVTQDMVDNLQAVVNGSPVLAEQLRQATTPPGPRQGAPVRYFDSLPGGANAGGTYTPTTGAINLPPGVLNQPPVQFQQSAHAVTDLTFVLGHEVQHGLNAVDKQAAHTAFLGKIAQIAQHGGPDYDYTGAIDTYQQASRRDEARAHVAGWNALLSREQQANPNANLTEMHQIYTQNSGTGRVNDFVELDPNTQQVVPISGFTFNQDGSLSLTSQNIEKTAQNYFDKSPADTRIGHHGDSDYPNYYGADAVSNVVIYHRHYATQPDGTVPPFRIDMAHLRLDEQLLERNGILFPSTTPPPTGASTDVRQPYVDVGQTPHAPGHFDYTRTPAGTHNQHQHVPVAPAPDSREQAWEAALSPRDDFSSFLDRMLAVAEAGDERTFREMTRSLAGLPAGQSQRAHAAETVDREQHCVEGQEMQRRQEVPALLIH